MSREPLREPLPGAPFLPRPIAARELNQLGLESVLIAPARFLPPAEVGDPPLDFRERLRQPVVRVGGAGGHFAELSKPRDGALQPPGAIERRPAPGSVEVPVLRQLEPGAPKLLARRVVIAAAPSAKKSPHAFGRVANGPLEPRVECFPEDPVLRIAGGDLERWIDAGIDGPLAQEIRAEGVDGADRCDLQLAQGVGESLLLLG